MLSKCRNNYHSRATAWGSPIQGRCIISDLRSIFTCLADFIVRALKGERVLPLQKSLAHMVAQVLVIRTLHREHLPEYLEKILLPLRQLAPHGMPFNEMECSISRCQSSSCALNMPQSPLLGLETELIPLTHQTQHNGSSPGLCTCSTGFQGLLSGALPSSGLAHSILDAHSVHAELSPPSVQVTSKESGYPRT